MNFHIKFNCQVFNRRGIKTSLKCNGNSHFYFNTLTEKRGILSNYLQHHWRDTLRYALLFQQPINKILATSSSRRNGRGIASARSLELFRDELRVRNRLWKKCETSPEELIRHSGDERVNTIMKIFIRMCVGIFLQ